MMNIRRIQNSLLVGLASLAALLVLLPVGDDAQASPDSTVRERALAHEELISDCMHGEGFEYVVALPGDVLMEETRAEAHASGEDVAEALAALELPDDPNDDIRNGLAPDKMSQYEQAYWGADGSDGCYGKTYEAAWGANVFEWGVEQEEALAQAEARIAGDQRVTAAKSELLACMARKGFVLLSYEAFLDFHESSSHDAVVAINGPTDAGPGSAVPADHPVWLAHLERMEAYGSAASTCHGTYLDVVQPIENQYLSEVWDTQR